MPPKPRTKYTNLPKYVTASNGRIVYRPRISPQDRKHIQADKHGYIKPPIRLGSLRDPEETIISNYLTAKATIDTRIGAEKHTVKWVVDEYQKSKTFNALAAGSRKRVIGLLGILDHPITVEGKDQTFGALPVRTVTKPIVRRLAEKRLDNLKQKGFKGTAQINLELSLLSSATKWATEFIDHLGVTDNPFRIKKFKVEPNTRYVTDKEYKIQKRQAPKITDYLPIVFEITYLVASRGIETLDIKLSDIDPDRKKGGIYINRRKGSKSNVIEWSDRLYDAYLDAKAIHKKHKISSIDAPLIIGSHGKQLTRSALDTAMARLKARMKSKGLKDVFWTLHRLKAKGISDATSDRIGGHKSEQMRERYKVKTERHKPAR